MLKNCLKSLRTGMLIALTSGLLGCGSGMEQTVEAASKVTTTAQTNGTQSAVTANALTVGQIKLDPISVGVDRAALAISAPSAFSSYVSTAYAGTLQATGGTPAYTWSIKSGALPAGLTLSKDGTVTGKPTVTGTVTVTLAVTDSSRPVQQATKTIAVTVLTLPLQITSSSLSDSRVGEAYKSTLVAIGGKPGYTWSSKGTLPKGISLSEQGVLSGTPTAAGLSTFIVTARDTNSPAEATSKVMAIVTLPARLNVSSSSLSNGQVGSSYAASLTATGGTTAYKWSISSGALPSGMSLSSTGAISGTPTTSGTTTFTAKVTDSGTPVQQATKSLSVTVAAPPLSITTGSVASGQSTVAYATQLSATGGTPAYTWSITSGSLPGGLTLAATTGVIQGTPSTSGSFPITYKATDNGSPQQSASASATITVSAAPAQSGTATWFIRTDGGTRYTSSNTDGQCDGKADTAYPGVGINQHCAFNDVRWMMWENKYGSWQWAMQGGDTLVIRGCKANAYQTNPDDPHCRIGWDQPNGNSNQNTWCWGAGTCALSPVPSGTAAQHTRILGGCAYDGNCNPVRGYPYLNNNLAQLFAGFSAPSLLALNSSQYVDIKGLELTAHNGQCARYGTTHPLPGCNRGSSYPLSDQSDQGITTDNQSSNITIENVYIHGFSSAGITGPIGGPFTLTNVSIDFNTFAGWNFDDGIPTPNAAGASITQSYVTMVGNGCQEEYPIVHTQFPAKGCWDSSTGGFGDAWSGQESAMDSFTCDHCSILYNTKDGAMGPHTQITSISLTNSIWVGNMGQAGKWGQRANASFLFQNNIVVGNCLRMSQQLPGAAQNFDQNVNLPGSGLGGYCRAAGALFAYFAGANSSVNFNNNTVITYQPTIWQVGCYATGTCATAPYHFTNNIVLGYTSAYNISPFNPGQPPGLYYSDDASVTFAGSHNLQYGVKNGDSCGTNGTICVDPQFTNEPSSFGTTESVLDGFNFHLTSSSPAIRAGLGDVSNLATDFYNNAQTTALTLGAVSQ